MSKWKNKNNATVVALNLATTVAKFESDENNATVVALNLATAVAKLQYSLHWRLFTLHVFSSVGNWEYKIGN